MKVSHVARIIVTWISFSLALAAQTISARIITTVAGTDITPFTSARSALTAAITVTSIAEDSGGNIYIVDSFQNVAYKVDTNGQVTRIGGNGFAGYSGDGGPALQASLNAPNGVAVDKAGNVYIGDTVNNRIRKIDTGGVITTIAGNGQASFSGDGGPSVNAVVWDPSQMFVDPKGNLIFSDFANNRIRKIDGSGIITTIAGNGKGAFSGDNGPATSAALNLPEAAALDSQGQLVIADRFNYRVRRVALDGTITTIAGTGDVNALQPKSVAADSAGNVYVSDISNNLIRRIDAQGNVTTFAGNGQSGYTGERVPAISSPLNYPSSLIVDNTGALILADEFGNRIRSISNGLIFTIAGNGREITTQDGTPALATVLNRPHGLTFDGGGNMYIADTFNVLVRKVDQTGIMTTIAGNGTFGFSGDNGPALQAQLNQPQAVAADSSGNIYIADTSNSRIRRVTPAGTISTYVGSGLTFPGGIAIDKSNNLYIADTQDHRIVRVSPAGMTTIAGTGNAGYSGDGSAATRATLNAPSDVSIDPSGNILIADTGNHVIRRINAQGIISTVAGNHQAGFSGDGGSALAASFNQPMSVAADSLGNIFVADLQNARVRQVSPNGTISTLAGDGVRRFQGDGGLASNASFSLPTRVVTDASNNVYVADANSDRIRVILAAAPSFQVTSTSVTLSASSNGAISDPQRVPLSSAVVGLQYSTSTVTRDGGSWLRVSADAASMPTNLIFRGDPTGLSQGTYNGTVTVQSAAGSAGPSLSVNATFQVGPPNPPKLATGTQVLTFGLIQGAPPATNQVSVQNLGSGSLAFSIKAQAAQGNWLTATSAAAAATPNAPATLTVVADPTGLGAGTYLGTVTLTSAGGSQTINVVMTVSPSGAKMVLSQAGLYFRAVAGAGAPLPRNFGILNAGQGSMSWTANSSTLSGTAGWLSIDSASGTVTRPLVDVSFINVSIDPTGLAPATYYGKVQVRTPGSTTQTVTVVLTVLPAGSALTAEVDPAGVVFTGIAGGNPGSQTVTINNRSGTAVTYVSSAATGAGPAWLVYAPAAGTVQPNQPQAITVQPDFSSLSAGTYQGSITIQFGDGTVQAVQVLAVVSPSGASASAGRLNARDSGNCSPSKLIIVPTATAANFTAYMGQTVQMGVKITDDCSNLLTGNQPSAAVRANFSDGTPDQNMSPGNPGEWGTSWQPRKLAAATITITAFRALANGQLLGNQLALTANVQTTPSTGARPSDVKNAASFASNLPIAPGSLISIFGDSFTDGSSQVAGGAPFPTMLDSVQVQVGDSFLPLFYAGPGQVNVQLPYDLPLNTQHQLLIMSGVTLSVPTTISVAPAQPGIFTLNQQGFGQGAIVNAITNVLADSSHPVKAGDAISIYSTGLGLVSPTVPPGALAPLSPLSNTLSGVSVTVGGLPAQVLFAGLAPGLTGLYQINAIIPAGVSPGPAVPVVVQVANQTTPTNPPVTIGVGN